MPTRFYDDLLRGSDGLLDQNMDPRDEPTAHLNVSVSAAASKNVNVSHNYVRQHEWTGEGEAQNRADSEKTNTAFTINHGDCKTTWTYAHDKFALKAAAKAFDQDDWRGNVTAAVEHKPAKNEWKVAPTLAVQSPDFSGFRLWFNTASEFVRKGDSWDRKFTPSINVSHENEWHFGGKAEHNGEKLNKSWVQAVWTPNNGDYWGRIDFTRKLFHAGCHQSNLHGKDIHHAYEVEYDFNDGAKGGLFDKNVALRTGASYQVSDKTELAANSHFNGEVEYHQEVAHNVDDHWTLGAWQHFNSANRGNQPRYDYGFSVNYRL